MARADQKTASNPRGTCVQIPATTNLLLIITYVIFVTAFLAVAVYLSRVHHGHTDTIGHPGMIQMLQDHTNAVGHHITVHELNIARETIKQNKDRIAHLEDVIEKLKAEQ